MTEGLYRRQVTAFTPNFDSKIKSVRFAAGAASAPSEEGAVTPKGFRGATEGERTRACCLHRGIDEHRAKKRPFAFAIVYIKCFRTYSVYLSFRHGVFILYTPRHLPPQREARRLPPQSADIAAVRTAAGGAKAVFSKGKGFSPHKFAVFVAPGRVFCYNTFNNTQNAQKGLFV